MFKPPINNGILVLCAVMSSPNEQANSLEIHLKTGLSISTAEQTGAKLRAAGLLKSTQGRNGGYSLAHDPRKYTLQMVINDLDPPDRNIFKAISQDLGETYLCTMLEDF